MAAEAAAEEAPAEAPAEAEAEAPPERPEAKPPAASARKFERLGHGLDLRTFGGRAPRPGPDMALPRSGLAAVRLNETVVLVAGGQEP